jgi:hypothetical protein
VYLASFAGRPAASVRVWAQRDAPLDDVWREILHPLGLADATPGRPFRLPDGQGAPATGAVEFVHPRGILVRIDGPFPGVLGLSAMVSGGRTLVAVDRYVYAEDAGAAARAERTWWQDRLADER